MSDWITAREAAEILGVHKATIPKMRRRGDLTTRPDGERPAFHRQQVIALRDRRAQPRPEQPSSLPGPPHEPWVAGPPDDAYVWLTSDQAAALMGVTRNAVNDRAKRGRLPSEMHDGRRWFRRDHLELVRRADQVKRGTRPIGRLERRGMGPA